MNLLKQFSSNTKLAEDGKEFQVTDDGFITIRRTDAKAIVAARELVEKPYKAILKAGGVIPPEKARLNLVKITCSALVVGWRGSDWIDEAGEPMEYSEENAMTIFNNRDYEPLLDMVWGLAADYKSFRDEEVKEIAKNSETE